MRDRVALLALWQPYITKVVPHAWQDTSLRVQSRPQFPQSEHVWYSGLSWASVADCQDRLQNQYTPESFHGLASDRQMEWKSLWTV